jgi:hypothetical protein
MRMGSGRREVLRPEKAENRHHRVVYIEAGREIPKPCVCRKAGAMKPADLGTALDIDLIFRRLHCLAP